VSKRCFIQIVRTIFVPKKENVFQVFIGTIFLQIARAVVEALKMTRTTEPGLQTRSDGGHSLRECASFERISLVEIEPGIVRLPLKGVRSVELKPSPIDIEIVRIVTGIESRLFDKYLFHSAPNSSCISRT
jgi:hypothetical protein